MKKQKKMVEAVSSTSTTSSLAKAVGPRKKKITTTRRSSSSEVVEAKQKVAVAALVAEEKTRTEEVDYFGDQAVVTAAEVDGMEDWRTWVRPEGLVDEQMSWGSVWYSFWEVDDGNANCHAFYGDVLEEDDIWDLRSIKQPPNATTH